ncbi:MAG: phosphatidylinositol transfer protein [Myxococcales bacterium]|nr:phosphatidylinositol transfer protein [Myxococcales bacterium]
MNRNSSPRSPSLVLALAGSLLACNGGDPPDTSGSGTQGTTTTSATASDSSTGSDETGVVDADGTTTTGEDTGPDPDTTTTGEPIECMPVPSCVAPPPNAGPTMDWEHLESSLVVASGAPRHRGRDMFYNPGDTQWVMAKFAYGPTDWDLEDERVDLFLLRGCEGDWEYLGPTFTTTEGNHATVEGVEDTGGRVYFQIPMPLGVGRHRIHMVVRGDDTRADTYIEVVEPGTPIFLSDIDGTLTTDEWERLLDFLLDNIPDVNEGAPQALHALAAKGYRPMYLTARPEFLGNRTYEFVELRGLPPGIIHTTLTGTGALGGSAATYKTDELAALAARGLVPAYVFGNTDSDAQAYQNAGIQPLDHRIFFQFEDAFGGRTIDSYLELVDEFEALAPVCE